MENTKEFQLLKLKVASEIVRSSQAVVAFSRAFYWEQVLIDKIKQEISDCEEEYRDWESKIHHNLNPRIERATYQKLFFTLKEHFGGEPSQVFKEFEGRVSQAELRRQAKSTTLQTLSRNSGIMGKFESLTLEELRNVQIPEFSCFINESDFGTLEHLNEEWGHFRNGLRAIVKSSRVQIQSENFNGTSCAPFSHNGLRDDDDLYHDHRIVENGVKMNSFCDSNALANSNTLTTIREPHAGGSSGGEVQMDDIGKTFANRSGNVLRKFSTLLRKGRRNSKVLSITETPEAVPEELLQQ